MKIFNWLHKTFHHDALKDGFDSNTRKAEPDVMIWDNQVSLKEVALVDMFGGWKDGILTIGTLGCYDPFKSSNQHRDYLALESEEDEEQDDQGGNYKTDGDDEEENKYCDYEHEEMNPLIHTTFKHNFDDGVNEKSNHANAGKVEELVTLTLTPTLVCHEAIESIDLGTDQKKKKGERITLADLFLADFEKVMKHDTAKVLLDQPSDKPSLKAKHGLPTLAKKLIPRVNKENPNPIKNIRKLMKKMIKKKIHPEVEVKNQKPDASGISENQKIEGASG